MKNSRAFTLIEVMVVLSILAIIAILAYNFFGSTMKEASMKASIAQVAKDFATLETAIQLSVQKNGGHVWGSIMSAGDFGPLVTDGYLKATPTFPQNLIADACKPWPGAPYDAALGYMDFGGPSTSAEYTLFGPDFCVTDEACKAWNEIHAPSIGSAIWDATGTVYPATEATFCAKQGAGNPNETTIFWVLERR